MKSFLNNLYFRLFMWSGSKFYPVVAIYNPAKDDKAPIHVVHFASSEWHLRQAAKELADQDLKDFSK
jgi:hypothetical protein